MSSLYPPNVLALPLQLRHRLPTGLQSVDLEVTLVAHSLVCLLSSLFTKHIGYALPLSLFGLVAVSSPSALTTLLPHFLFFWILSLPLDLLWLVYHIENARLIVIAMMFANTCFKLVSSSQAAHILQSHGMIPELQGYGGFQGWLASENGGMPGSWSGQGANPAQEPYTDARQAAMGGYRSVYDEGDGAEEGDAPQVRVDHVASKFVPSPSPSAPRLSKGEPHRGDYQTME